VTGSSIGFGHNPFGHHQWGLGDWAEEMLWKNMPVVYQDCDESGPAGSAVQLPLRAFQTALKASYQDIRVKWLNFPFLWDAIKVPLDQLPQLGYNVGINVDPTKSEGLQRSYLRSGEPHLGHHRRHIPVIRLGYYPITAASGKPRNPQHRGNYEVWDAGIDHRRRDGELDRRWK